jgi:hypothetical protein
MLRVQSRTQLVREEVFMRRTRGLPWLMALLCGAVALRLLSIYQAPQEITAANAPETLPSSTRIVLNGEKIFPIGLYHTSWAGEPEQKYDALEKIGAAGFNLMHPALKTEDLAFVRRANELGVNLIIEANEPDGTKQIIEAFKDEPNVLGWLVADDFNSESRVQTPAEIRKQVNLVKRIAPNQYTYMSGNTAGLDQFIGLTDIVGIQTYSIPSDPLDVTNTMLSYTLTYTSPADVSLIANLQTWAAKNRRPPTPEEVRNITYQALINGVDGILYYTYLDEIWNIEDHPEIWTELTRIAPEVRLLMPAIIDGTLRIIDSETDGVRVGQWSYKEKRYLVMINMTTDPIIDFTLQLPEVSQITPMFTDRPDTFTLTDGVIIGNLEPEVVYVYVVE